MSQEESTQDTAAQNNNLCCVTYLWEWVSFTLICSAGVDGQMIACFPQRSQRKGTSFLISPDLNGAMFDTLLELARHKSTMCLGIMNNMPQAMLILNVLQSVEKWTCLVLLISIFGNIFCLEHDIIMLV